MELRDLDDGASVDLVLLVRAVSRRVRREGGEPFLKLELADRSQTLPAIVWEDADEVAGFVVRGATVRVEGKLELSERYGRQLAIERLSPVAREQVDLSTLLEGPSVPVAELERRLAALVERTGDRWIRALLERVFDREGGFWPRFREAPAAKFFHEAYPHGLLDHTVRVAEAVEALVPHFGDVDRDVAVAGALLHDIGKAQTYTSDPIAPELTDLGRLEGHIVLGYEIVRRVIGALDGFPEETARSIRHIVLSHHGKQEYGSPVVPATREAVLVHHVDDLGARMGSFDRLQRGLSPEDRWSGYDRAIGSAAYFGPARREPDPLEAVDPPPDAAAVREPPAPAAPFEEPQAA
ncbi:3'-5' exoribonuclease YhaM family protein [Patulibacter defluvii]|uniref:3'-5' exoribonuclease YhaM family protein n=1 Tax=Patulibacter defluvii TaxID=3095358 RepID=UPI002A74CA52|nr:HD domain-containing protein [Patulibacter sp. DM4]